MMRERDINSLDGRELVTKSENTDQKHRRYFANEFAPSLTSSSKETSNLTFSKRAPGTLLYKVRSDKHRIADYALARYRMPRYLKESAKG